MKKLFNDSIIFLSCCAAGLSVALICGGLISLNAGAVALGVIALGLAVLAFQVST